MNACPECGASLPMGKTCRDYLHDMITWDFEDFMGAGQVHHLTVLCYNLQHPSNYSQKGLEDAMDFLKEFVVHNASFEEHDKRNRDRLSSDVRDWKITASEQDVGHYDHQPVWTMRAIDVAMAGKDGYEDRVREWAKSVYNAITGQY